MSDLATILKGATTKENLDAFLTFNSIYIKKIGNTKLGKMYQSNNTTQQAEEELLAASNYLVQTKAKLALSGIILDIRIVYDYKMRIVFQIENICDSSIPQASKSNTFNLSGTDSRKYSATIKQFIDTFTIKYPRITYGELFLTRLGIISDIREKEIKRSMEYSSSYLMKKHFDIISQQMYLLCKESYKQGSGANISYEYATPYIDVIAPYEKICSCYDMIKEGMKNFLNQAKSIDNYDCFDMVDACENIKLAPSRSDFNEISVVRKAKLESPKILTEILKDTMDSSIFYKVYIKQIMTNPTIKTMIQGQKEWVYIRGLIDNIHSDVIDQLQVYSEPGKSDRYLYRTKPNTRGKHIGERVRTDAIKFRDKRRLAELAYRTLDLVDEYNVINIDRKYVYGADILDKEVHRPVTGPAFKLILSLNENTYDKYRKIALNLVEK
jgi:hypothetical protein